MEPSALSELELWFLCQNLIFEFSVVVCDLFAAHNQNWATLLQTEGLAPNGVVSTTQDMRTPPTVLEVAALLRGYSTSKGARALEAIREGLKLDSMDAGIGHLARLYSTTYNFKNGNLCSFSAFP